MTLRRIIARRPEAWRPRRLGIAYDRDEAGAAAAERLKGELAKLGIGSHRVLFPKGMDANEYACKVTPASQSLAVLLNRAEWWGKSMAAPNNEQPAIDDEKTAAKEETRVSAPTKNDSPDEVPLAAEPIERPPETAGPVEQPEPFSEPQPVIPLAAEAKIEVHGDEITIVPPKNGISRQASIISGPGISRRRWAGFPRQTRCSMPAVLTTRRHGINTSIR